MDFDHETINSLLKKKKSDKKKYEKKPINTITNYCSYSSHLDFICETINRFCSCNYI